MFGSQAIEIAISFSFLFFILSLVVSSARELIESWLQTRSIHLERGIRELLADETGTGMTKALYDHPLISSLFRGSYEPETQLVRHIAGKDGWNRLHFRSHLPSYIPARNFALAVFDLATGHDVEVAGVKLSFDQMRERVSQLDNKKVRRAVLIAMDQSKGDVDRARLYLQDWYDSSMDRVSGWYRKQTHWILIALGLFIAVALNVDTLRLAEKLYKDDAVRSAIVAEAQATATQVNSATTAPANAEVYRQALGCAQPETPLSLAEGKSCAQRRLEKLSFPIGWSGAEFSWASIPGWLLTALALSLGAPFWFDLLNKMMVIRSTVKPHEKSPEESSEDRQLSAATPASPKET